MLRCTITSLGLLWSMALSGPKQAVARYDSSLPLRICYVSPALGHVLPRATDLPSHNIGFRFAVERFNLEGSLHAEFIHVNTTPQPLCEALDSAAEMGCHAIVGLVRSKDALLAGATLEKHGMIGFSSTAKSDALDLHFPHILSASTSALAWSRAAREVVEASAKSVVLVVRPGDEFSYLFSKEIQKALGSWVQKLELGDDLQLNMADLTALSASNTIFIYTTYPLIALPSLRQLGTVVAPQWRVLANHTWTETHVLKSRPDILLTAPPLFTLSPWQIGRLDAAWSMLQKEAFTSMNVTPDHDSAYDYDVANMILNCYKTNASSTSLRHAIKSCLTGAFDFTGVTGQYRFSGDAAHPQRIHYLYEIGPTGLIPPTEVL